MGEEESKVRSGPVKVKPWDGPPAPTSKSAARRRTNLQTLKNSQTTSYCEKIYGDENDGPGISIIDVQALLVASAGFVLTSSHVLGALDLYQYEYPHFTDPEFISRVQQDSSQVREAKKVVAWSI